jgi:hypothetical protein
VIIVAVDHSDIDWALREFARGRKPAKAGADDNDPWSITGHGLVPSAVLRKHSAGASALLAGKAL